MERSESIKEIASALCAFQGEVEKIKKTATNPFFKSKYATLADILDVIRQPLVNNGLAVIQLPFGEHGLTTLIMHKSGEFISEGYQMQPTKNDPQGAGSVITYQRRYALGAVLGLNIDEDDDANKASEPIKEPVKIKEKPFLTPDHPNWQKVIDYLKTDGSTMSDVLKKYQIDKKTESLLIDATLE